MPATPTDSQPGQTPPAEGSSSVDDVEIHTCLLEAMQRASLNDPRPGVPIGELIARLQARLRDLTKSET
ncbi:hypothetical protein EFV37_35840 (plasmid) [Mesorhizobium loti]|nr:hypothetical protein EB229_35815 [Mesorhizobium jarvisii]QKD13566.1 hypothetical protein EFV37_35840 [Mesorhizobium loti]